MLSLCIAVANPISPLHIVLLIVVVVLAVLTPFLVRRGRRRRPTQSDEPRPRIGPEVLGVQQVADAASLRLLEAGREIQARIDTKIRVLNKLIKDADAQSERLQALLEAAEVKEPEAEGTTTVANPRRTGSGRWVSDIHSRIETLQKQGRSPAEIARATRLSVQEVNLVLHLLAESG